MIEKLPRLQTQERILNAAQQLYVEHGINATSMRDITQVAEVNLAAVNYYFGSKNLLTKELFLQHFLPYIQQCHLALFAQDHESSMDDILDALIIPLQALADSPDLQSIRLLCRISNECPEIVQEQIRDNAADMVHLLLARLEKQLPCMPEEVLRRRLFFIFKLLFYSLNGDDSFNLYKGQTAEVFNARHILNELRSFIQAGLLAPVLNAEPLQSVN